MDLKSYWDKRHFDETPEPRGEIEASGQGLLFVVQMHDASQLHFDFRLEMGGVLKSWAVPRGPSLNPAEKRLAVEVEDHPKAYGDFEGVIPEAQYGAGTVLLWDRGSWHPDGDPVESYRKGHIRFSLQGEKLKGQWSLLRLHENEGGKRNWLLLKHRDQYAGNKALPGKDSATSVVSGLRLDEIAAGKRHAGKKNAKSAARRKKTDALPARMEAQLATLASALPGEGEWLAEIKFDGYRILSRIEDEKVSLWTRNGKEWTSRLQDIADDLAGLGVESAWLDGELVAMDKEGKGSFELLQQAFGRDGGNAGGLREHLRYYLFDISFLNGRDLTALPQKERKRLLRELLEDRTDLSGDSMLRYSDHVEGHLDEVWQQACLHGEEGIIIKAANAPYLAGRGRSWLKLKCRHRQEFVVGGYSDPEGSREGFGALLLGYYAEDGRFLYVGRTGTGFSLARLASMVKDLQRHPRQSSPFDNTLSAREAEGAHWVRPGLVVEVRFTGWTRHHRLRQAVFVGVREDKAPHAVQEGPPSAAAEAARKKEKEEKSEEPVSMAGITLTHPSRLVYPDTDYRKRDVALYYGQLADRLLPHLAGRPLSLLRCPDGVAGSCFFQKHMTESMPDFLPTVTVQESGGEASCMLVNNSKSLLALVQMGALEFHTWGARSDRLDRPDRLVFDLDPGPDVSWREICEGAQLVRALLHELELPAYLKTSGGKGLHVEVPLLRVHDWEEVKAFSRGIALHMEKELPQRFVASMAKGRRRSRLFVDYLRNAPGATTVAAYSLRARAGAPIATPLRWKELGDVVSAAAFTLENIHSRLASLSRDPWSGYEAARARIKKSAREAMRKAGDVH